MVQQLQNLVGPSPLEQLLGGFAGGFQQSFAQKQQAQAQEALQRQQFEQQQQLLQQKGLASEQRRQSLLASLGLGPVQAPASDVGFQQQQGIAPQQEIQEGGILEQALFDPSQVSNEQLVALSLQDPNLAKVVQEQKNQIQKVATENRKEIRESFKDTKDYRSKTTSDFKEVNLVNARLNRMEKLNETGKLAKPLTTAIAEKLNVPVALFGNPDSEEFDKLSKDLLKGIKTYFPGRINVVEVENFLKTIPTLMQSQEGRSRVINNIKLLSEPQLLQFDAMREITREAQSTGQPLPFDLEEVVLERIQPRLDEIVQQVSEGLAPGEQTDALDLEKQQTFDSLPPATELSGRTITDTNTGRRFRSNGKKWTEVK